MEKELDEHEMRGGTIYYYLNLIYVYLGGQCGQKGKIIKRDETNLAARIKTTTITLTPSLLRPPSSNDLF